LTIFFVNASPCQALLVAFNQGRERILPQIVAEEKVFPKLGLVANLLPSPIKKYLKLTIQIRQEY
jgi:hypothetical protein